MKNSLSTFDVMKHVASKGSLIALDETQAEELRNVLKMMLSDITDLCNRNGITFFMGGGSCLGAVRHHGFIPWDDDIDLNMPREETLKFVAALEKEYPDKYVVHTPWSTTDYGLGLLHVRLKGTSVRGHSDYQTDAGVFVDIFVMERVPDNPIMRCMHGVVSLALGFAVSCVRFYRHADVYRYIASDDKDAGRIFERKISVGKLLSFCSLDTWTRAWDRWNSLYADKDTRCVAFPVGRRHYFGEIHPKEVFYPISEGSFEGIKVPIPHKVDTYLSKLYGPNYMTPPPESSHESHVVLDFDLGEYASSNYKEG